ncbi:uncharacterized protein EI90DRAFT_3074311 [Cantharellus anzutake]|uniref:uncharacterized protein n=1 Tax=Cantharellus anzutake TaxID=1750568 RepID=UPI0019038977|nr:uncharacterized protein EI90DRAFT_3074311 [Cantharellus anzutake]KAF8324895.1 hypothetical protein EI90DRAFT_3074311 [Cantharellus anzutake]
MSFDLTRYLNSATRTLLAHAGILPLTSFQPQRSPVVPYHISRQRRLAGSLDVDPEKEIYEKWRKQQSHRWQHHAKVVPWMRFISNSVGNYLSFEP